MTMQHHDHPQDERLAALAGNDPEALADRALIEHVSACARCDEIVTELQALRSALAELPDLAPSRRLQLVPPVPAPAPRAGWLARLRGLAAPVMVTGAGLALVGAVGLGGLATRSFGTAGAAAPEAVSGGDYRSTSDTGTYTSGPAALDGQSPKPSATASPTASAQPPARNEAGGQQRFLLTDTSTPAPWLVLIVGGAILLTAGLLLRFRVQPRAG